MWPPTRSRTASATGAVAEVLLAVAVAVEVEHHDRAVAVGSGQGGDVGQLLRVGLDRHQLTGLPNAASMASAISRPRSSWRKWAAPSIRTCSSTVGISSMKRSPARG